MFNTDDEDQNLWFYKPVVHNVRPAGQIRPATSLDVARDVQQK